MSETNMDGSIKVQVQVIAQVKTIDSDSSEELAEEEWPSLDCMHGTRILKGKSSEVNLLDRGSGQICTKYIPLSHSSVFRHAYYTYPAVKDPGITKALLDPEKKIFYPEDGQMRYMAICEELHICPIKIFYTSLLKDAINLRHYCVTSNGIFAITKGLEYNRNVQLLDLTYNFLNHDGAYHLGDMLSKNITLSELDLTGCRIGSEGVRYLFSGLIINRSLRKLNLNRNKVGNDGCVHIASAMVKGINVSELYLSYNEIGAQGIVALAEAYDLAGAFTHLDLSWNNLFTPFAICKFLSTLETNQSIMWLDLSWNNLSGNRVALSLKLVLNAPNISHLDISNNRFSGESILIIVKNLKQAKKLITLNLSYNPMEPEDAYACLYMLRLKTIRLKNLLMENVPVNSKFMNTLEKIKMLKHRLDTVITFGDLRPDVVIKETDMKEIAISRTDYLLFKQPKKNKKDIALIIKRLYKDKKLVMPYDDFLSVLNEEGIELPDSLFETLMAAFPGGKNRIDIKSLADYVERKWPERQLPPTPPPEPEPEPQPDLPPPPPPPKGKKGKGKK